MIRTSDDLHCLTKTQLVDTFAPVFAPPRGTNRMMVIGGSHSAFIVTERLAKDLCCAGLDEIAIILR